MASTDKSGRVPQTRPAALQKSNPGKVSAGAAPRQARNAPLLSEAITQLQAAAGKRRATRGQRFEAVAFRLLLRSAPLQERIRLEREGVPSIIVQDLIDDIGVSSADFQRYVGVAKATFTKKMKEMSMFSGTTGQSVVGLMDLINKVEDMLSVEDTPEARNFDVERWVGRWIQKPQPALGGLPPAEFLDTPSGRESVMRILGAMQSGAYQ